MCKNFIGITPSPALQSVVLSPRRSFGKLSPGKVAGHQPANDVTTSLSPSSNVVSSTTAVLQSSVAASLANSGISAASLRECLNILELIVKWLKFVSKIS
jgi:hypothetical protein